jgi:GNAT superfamily N-acetyltransferase
VSAHIDRNFNEFQKNAWGLWGWFECEDDPAVARALLDAAAGWLGERDRDRMVGPMDFTTNDEIGLLIAGHERPPVILCQWHHPYYQRLLEHDLGMGKAMDVYMWSLHITGREKVHPRSGRSPISLSQSTGSCADPSARRTSTPRSPLRELYNTVLERNWGFVPLTEEEVYHYAKDLKPILDENWAMFAERKDTGEIVGGALTLLDYNQVLAKPNGRLLPFGWIRALRERRRIDAVRVIVLGVMPDYRHTGVAARLYQMHFDAAERTPQKGGEIGWTLEVNEGMNRALEGMGAEITRRYRTYERTLA